LTEHAKQNKKAFSKTNVPSRKYDVVSERGSTMTGVSKKTAREFCLTWSAGRLLFFHPVFRNSFQEKEREKMNTEREKDEHRD